MQEFAFQTAKRKAYLSSECLLGSAIDDFIRKTGKRKHTLLIECAGFLQKRFCFKPNQHPQLYKKYVGSLLTPKTPLREELTRDELTTSGPLQLKHPHLRLALTESSGR